MLQVECSSSGLHKQLTCRGQQWVPPDSWHTNETNEANETNHKMDEPPSKKEVRLVQYLSKFQDSEM